MIVQNVSAASTGRTDISFTVPKADAAAALKALAAERGLRPVTLGPDGRGRGGAAPAGADGRGGRG